MKSRSKRKMRIRGERRGRYDGNANDNLNDLNDDVMMMLLLLLLLLLLLMMMMIMINKHKKTYESTRMNMNCGLIMQ
jgi:hypothetical protein